jgi:hypothetical protein
MQENLESACVFGTSYTEIDVCVLLRQNLFTEGEPGGLESFPENFETTERTGSLVRFHMGSLSFV